MFVPTGMSFGPSKIDRENSAITSATIKGYQRAYEQLEHIYQKRIEEFIKAQSRELSEAFKTNIKVVCSRLDGYCLNTGEPSYTVYGEEFVPVRLMINISADKRFRERFEKLPGVKIGKVYDSTRYGKVEE